MGISTGSNMEREKFQEMMRDIKKEKPYAVVVVKIDRYARSLIDLLKNGGKYIDPKKVIELKEKGLSARAISKFMGCSITPILEIIKNEIKL